MSSQTQPPNERMIFRQTDRKPGRSTAVTPANSTMRHLCYGRILLGPSTPAVSFATGERETALLCLAGTAEVRVGSERFQLGKYDALYVPRDTQLEVTTAAQADVAEFSAAVANRYPVQFVSYGTVSKDPALSFRAGKPGDERQLNVVVGKNVEAGRLMLGFTISQPGNWTSWPPHEHEEMLEEMYVFFDMPAPAFALQLVYRDTEYPESIMPVREGDAVMIPAGYHPNVAVPWHRVCFMWAMAAHREKEDRQFGVVNVQPDFSQGGSGLEAARK
jgi:5-deoxy-glucuronate isomerase